MRVFGWGAWRRRNLLARWRENRYSYLADGVVSWDGELLELKDALFCPTSEESRWYLALRGAEQLDRMPRVSSLQSIDFRVADPEKSEAVRQQGPVVALRRIEWANLYHSMADLYNVYLAARFLGWDPSQVQVLFLDHHSDRTFAGLWSSVFAGTLLAGDLPATRFEHLALSPTNHDSYFDSHLSPTPPYLRELSGVLREGFGLPASGETITLVSRERCRERVVTNEDELVAELRKRLPDCPVLKVVLEDLSLTEQIQVIGNTRLLVGAHGAGLTYSYLLPPGSGLFELFPTVTNAGRLHFLNICLWRGLPYRAWINWRQWREPVDGRTSCEVEKVASAVVKMWRRLSERR